jgi:hypothetical protein
MAMIIAVPQGKAACPNASLRIRSRLRLQGASIALQPPFPSVVRRRAAAARGEFVSGNKVMSDFLGSPPARSQPQPDQAGTLEMLAALFLVAFVVAMLYVGREIFIPIAIAILVSFVLSPRPSGGPRHWRREPGKASQQFGTSLKNCGRNDPGRVSTKAVPSSRSSQCVTDPRAWPPETRHEQPLPT